MRGVCVLVGRSLPLPHLVVVVSLPHRFTVHHIECERDCSLEVIDCRHVDQMMRLPGAPAPVNLLQESHY